MTDYCTYTAKQLSRSSITGDLENLLSLYKEYRYEYDSLAEKAMENHPTHNYFFNWLGIKGCEKEQNLLGYLEGQQVQICNPVEPVFEKYLTQEEG